MNLVDALIIPALWTPDTSNDEWQETLWTAVEATFALGDFINGRISADAYLDHIAELGIDPMTLGEKLDELESQSPEFAVGTGFS